MREDCNRLLDGDRFFPLTGAKVTLSSDWDVNPKNPLVGIRNAVTRGRQAVDVQVRLIGKYAYSDSIFCIIDYSAKFLKNKSVDKVCLQTAIEMYTINGAYLMRQEDRVGSIAVGKEADIVVLDRNIVK